MATTRGQITYPARAKQIRDFRGLEFGTITPTDIDGVIDYHHRGWFIMDLKLIGAPMLDGQRKALERMTDDLYMAGRLALCVIAEHNTPNPEEPIDAANALVTQYRYLRRWGRPKTLYTVREVAEQFIQATEQNDLRLLYNLLTSPKET